eukprot:2260431-Prymnesium_polylepis.2
MTTAAARAAAFGLLLQRGEARRLPSLVARVLPRALAQYGGEARDDANGAERVQARQLQPSHVARDEDDDGGERGGGERL